MCKLDFSTTLNNIHFKLLHCSTLEMEAFKTSAIDAMCSECKGAQMYDCASCSSVKDEKIDTGNHNVIMKWLKPWLRKFT